MKTTFIFFYILIYCVGAGKTTLMSISDGLDPYFFRRKMEKTQSVREEMDGKVFVSRQSRHLSFWWIIWLKYFSLFVPWSGV